MMNSKAETAVFGGGCFWCTEAVFSELKGVTSVESGYAGGHTKNPSYEEVCSGTTGHAEVIKITFDPAIVSFEKLLEVFFLTHDPTTLNRQGADVGTQYRSAVFYTSNEQKEKANEVIKAISDKQAYSNPIVTEVSELSNYYVAENYHQDYFSRNGNQPYCRIVIQPKMEKFRKAFSDLTKK